MCKEGMEDSGRPGSTSRARLHADSGRMRKSRVKGGHSRSRQLESYDSSSSSDIMEVGCSSSSEEEYSNYEDDENQNSRVVGTKTTKKRAGIGKKITTDLRTERRSTMTEPEFSSRLQDGCRFRCELCAREFLHDIHVNHLATNHQLSVEKYTETFGPITFSKVDNYRYLHRYLRRSSICSYGNCLPTY